MAIILAQCMKLGAAVLDFAGQDGSAACAAGPVAAAVRQDQALPQGGIEDGFVRFGLKLVRAGLDADLESHQNSMAR